MSHNPRQNYGYPQLPPDYYVDDPEGFASEYSDSDALSENQRQSFGVAPPRHLPEIYDRNSLASHQMITGKQQYSSQPYIQQYYHNRNLPQIPRTQSAIPPQTYPHPYNNSLQRHFYPSEEINYDYAGSQQKVMAQMQQYKSAMRKVSDPASYNVMSKQTNPKRYPVTVGTPKYYRKPPVNSIYKRPSALCLPVASQPDPAAYRRPKRAPVFNDQTLYGMQQEIPSGMENPSLESPVDDGTKDQIDAVLVPHKVDSEGDVDAKISNFEELLAKFERENGPKKTKSRNDISKISKFLKPRVPSSIRAKQEKSKAKAAKLKGDAVGESNSTIINNTDPTDVQDVTADSLERLLNQLKKCELAVGNESVLEKNDCPTGARQRKDKAESRENEGGVEKGNMGEDEKNPKPSPKSFNYRDISEQMLRSQCELDVEDSNSSIQDITKRITNSLTDSTPNKPRPFNQICRKPTMDDHCALELHRSKSYIVNLIDRALSKELGTVPGERSRRKFVSV
ncbi:uncharacterized protein isoform X2 [Leptinotarsa decemlineata]|uniref:uncharacterized protein isoform X2 n=1 Tax=Leptinotarsa decemlineata TaxID=7539 RepID=UPI003D30680E